MKQQNETPLYATLLYDVRKKLDISITEYFYVDMVYHLSKNEKGWCFKSLESVASDMGITKTGVVKLRDRMIDRGLLKKSIKGYVKTTEMYNSVVRSGKIPYNSVSNRTTQLHADVQLSGTKNNNENNLDNKGIEKRGKGYDKAREIRDSLSRKLSIDT